VLDWDDTLFPTTYIRCGRSKDDSAIMAALEGRVCDLLRRAHRLGQIVIVTLARPGWIAECCCPVFPQLAELLNRLNVQVVYARSYPESASAVTFKDMKAKAIAGALSELHVQYKGQSWKNIISIGDSEFERLGTKQATSEYMLKRNCESAMERHVFNVRTKTVKLAERPGVDSLRMEVEALLGWLEDLIKLDGSADLVLTDPRDAAQLNAIDITLGRRGLHHNQNSSILPWFLRAPSSPSPQAVHSNAAPHQYQRPGWWGHSSTF
jgi:hypothetical protein